ncbi:MAG: hypothetical protein JEY99_04925 [Spirochaetales bacterium]|nr:hypothetical protein [Spirochaetales bacterium]
MFTINSEALEILAEMQKDRTRDTDFLTICSSGTGCGGPLLKIELRTPLDDDILQEVAGFSFHIRRDIHDRLDGAVIKGTETFWGKKLKIDNGTPCL